MLVVDTVGNICIGFCIFTFGFSSHPACSLASRHFSGTLSPEVPHTHLHTYLYTLLECQLAVVLAIELHRLLALASCCCFPAAFAVLTHKYKYIYKYLVFFLYFVYISSSIGMQLVCVEHATHSKSSYSSLSFHFLFISMSKSMLLV